MNDLYRNIIGSIIRGCLMLLSGYLVTKHILNQSPDATAIDMITSNIVAALPALAAQAWSILQKWYMVKVAHTALAAAPGTTMETVKNRVDAGMGVRLRDTAGVAVLLTAAVLSLTASACASAGGLSTKQQITVDVLQPTHDALASFQDLEIGLFKGGDIPQLTPQVHIQIEGKLAIAFKSHALATRAIRTWVPGTPVPIDIMQLHNDVLAVQGVLSTAGISPTTQLGKGAQATVDKSNAVIVQMKETVK